MTQNSIWIQLNVKDNGTRILNGLKGTMRGAVLQANLLTAGIQAGLNSIGGLGSLFNEAVDIQQGNISTAGDLMRLMGTSYDEATNFVDRFSNKMAEVAAALPGETQAYVDLGKSITDNLVTAFQDVNGVLDQRAFEDSLFSISRNAGFRASTAGIQSGDAGLAISKFVGGSSVSELQQLRFFERNPAVMAFIEQGLDDLGQDLDQLSRRQRVELIEKALAVPDDIIDASNKSISGMLEGFRSSLFDPQTGIFGLFRDLDDDIEGNQTLLDTIGKTINLLIGNNGLFAAISKTFTGLGINFGDPLVTVRSGLEAFNLWLEGVSNGLPDFDFMNSGEAIASLVNRGIRFLSNLPIEDYLTQIGGLIGRIFNEVVDFAVNIDYASLGQVLFNGISGLFRMAGAALLSLDATSIAAITAGVLIQIGVVPFMTTVATGIAGLAGLAISPIGILVALAGLSVVNLIRVVMAHSEQIFPPILTGIQNLFQAVWSPLQIALGIVTGNGEMVVSGFQNLMTSLSGLAQQLLGLVDSILAQIPGVQTFGQRSANAAMERAEANYQRALANSQGRGPQAPQARFNGWIPNASSGFVGGLIDAAIREGRNMPSGSNLILANSSEAILNRGQQQALGNVLGRSGAQSETINIGSITINAGATSDPQQLVAQFMEELESRLQSRQRQRLTPNYS